jgi:hypothetical protein
MSSIKAKVDKLIIPSYNQNLASLDAPQNKALSAKSIIYKEQEVRLLSISTMPLYP